MAEGKLLNDIQIRFSRAGRRLFRNVSAAGWFGEYQRFDHVTQIFVAPGDVLIRRAHRLQTGLVKGASDLIGWTPIKITAEMIGRTLAVFTAIEVKTDGVRTTKEQRIFVDNIYDQGGIAGVVRTPDEAEAVISEFERREAERGTV